MFASLSGVAVINIWRLSVKQRWPEMWRRSGAQEALYDWGGGLIWLRTARARSARGLHFQRHAICALDAETLATLPVEQRTACWFARLSAGIRASLIRCGFFVTPAMCRRPPCHDLIIHVLLFVALSLCLLPPADKACCRYRDAAGVLACSGLVQVEIDEGLPYYG